MKRSSNPCDQRRPSLSLLASGELSEGERNEIERHLAGCADCRSYYEEIKTVAVSLANYRDSVVSVEPTQATRENWARAILESAQAGGERNQQSWGCWWQELFWPYRHAWGVMAALWVAMWVLNWESPRTHGAVTSSLAAQTYIEEQRFLAELISPPNAEPADAPRRQGSPRSELARPAVAEVALLGKKNDLACLRGLPPHPQSQWLPKPATSYFPQESFALRATWSPTGGEGGGSALGHLQSNRDVFFKASSFLV